jgi:hypothetical protein
LNSLSHGIVISRLPAAALILPIHHPLHLPLDGAAEDVITNIRHGHESVESFLREVIATVVKVSLID